MFQHILTERLKLRNLQPDDCEAMFAYRSNPQISQYQFWEPKSLQEIQSFISNNSARQFDTPGWYQIAISLRENDVLIGDCGIHILETDSRIAEVGITIAPAYQSLGYANEALLAVLNLCFSSLKKHRVFASVDPQNLPSMALLKRIGLRQEAHFIQSLWFKNSWVDEIIFAMLSSEWEAP